jgi:hypothetical protein
VPVLAGPPDRCQRPPDTRAGKGRDWLHPLCTGGYERGPPGMTMAGMGLPRTAITQRTKGDGWAVLRASEPLP